MRTAFVACAVAFAAGCYAGTDEATPSRGVANVATVDGGPSQRVEGNEPSGLPCDVDAILRARCHACHGSPPSGPVRLVTWDDLAASSPAEPAATVATRVLARIRDDARPMPPSPVPRLSPADVATMEQWITSGMPRGACGGASSGDAGVTVDLTCSSGAYWRRGRKGAEMNPGRACIACHNAEGDDGPIVHIGGTVYPSLFEEDTCYGVDGTMDDTRVVITDVSGAAFELPVGPTGNFSLRTSRSRPRAPWSVKVVSQGRERKMNASPPHGDCNFCHTERGRNGAPGRIVAP